MKHESLEEIYSRLPLFAAVVEEGSFSAAARLHRMTPSAVSRTVQRLEQRLKVKLLKRSTRSVTLTMEGRDLYERIVGPIAALKTATEKAASEPDEIDGLIKVSLPAIIGEQLIGQVAQDFLSAHPRARLEVSLTDHHDHLVAGTFDLALRLGQPSELEWTVRKLADLTMVLVAAPSYLADVGQPTSIDDLAQFSHIRYQLGGRPYPIVFANGRKLFTPGRFDTDSGRSMIQAALHSIGIAQLAEMAVRRELDEGSLVPVLANVPLAQVPLVLLHPFGALVPKRVKIFSEFLAAHITT